MKFQMTVVALGLVSLQVFAGEIRDIGAISQQAESLQAEASALQAKIDANNARVKKIAENLELAQSNREAVIKTTSVKVCDNTVMQGTFGIGCEKKETIEVPDAVQKAFDAAERERPEIAKLQSENANLNVKLRAAQDQFGAAQSKAGELTAEQKQQAGSLTWSMGNTKLDLNSQKLDLLTANQILNKISEIHDRTVLGVYLRDKMGQLLSSQAFCDAQKSCSTGMKDADAIQRKLKKELFPSQTFDVRTTPKSPAASPATGIR